MDEADEPVGKKKKEKKGVKERKERGGTQSLVDDAEEDQEPAAKKKKEKEKKRRDATQSLAEDVEEDQEPVVKKKKEKEKKGRDASQSLAEDDVEDHELAVKKKSHKEKKGSDATESLPECAEEDQGQQAAVNGNAGEEPKPNKDVFKVYVGEIPFSWDKDTLRKHFSACGAIDWMHMPQDALGRPAGFAFISYWDQESVDAALELDGRYFGGRKLKVNMATDKPAKLPKEKDVFIGGLPFSCTEEVLKKDFSECGAIARLNMPLREDGSSKGIAFITFKKAQAVAAALAFHGTEYGGRTLTVRLSSQKPEPRSISADAKANAGKDAAIQSKKKEAGKQEIRSNSVKSEKAEPHPFEVIVKGLGFKTKEESLREELQLPIMPMAGRAAGMMAMRESRRAPQAEVGNLRARAAIEGAAEMTRGAILMKKYDTDGSGKLEVEDLKKMLTEFNYQHPVSDDEVRFVLEATDNSGDGAIEIKEVQMLLRVWNTYQRSIPEIESLMKAYDTDGSGCLEPEELTRMLVQLNEGKPVTQKDVEFVVKEAGLLAGDGTVTKPEIKRAIRAWYTLVDVKQESACCTAQ